MDLDEAKRLAGLALSDVHPPDGSQDDGWRVSALDRSDVPLPELVLVGLTELVGLESWGPEEKLRWGVSGRVGNIPFSVTLQKFGPRLYLPKDATKEDEDLVIARLRKAGSLAEAYLRTVAETRIRSGAVTILNEYARFDGAYQFFRTSAASAYASAPPERTIIATDENGNPTGWAHEPFKPEIEGGYLAGAMLDAYFSRLEHLLVLLLPFLGFDASDGAAVEFVGLTWDEKWKRVFDVNADTAAKAAYDSLKQLKESIRNPISHGGFGKRGTSFLFHVERVGALPALLSKHGKHSEFVITRIPSQSYEQLCSDLDAVDAFIRGSHVWAGVRYAEAGLNMSLDDDFQQKCAAASRDDDSLDEFLDYQSYLHDMHANMDY